ncbi:hypothetical protein CMUS01_10697 [Colletotrichum musicola]|uniref:Uncharacterized protein n=1 Tax=Colletotrichum musicola TaxID=2175873 RepID=A0A8H6K221_9PEZI|nr:hypothetical protein CMUS01_10697 [Colletotrichum musicola]
MSETSCRDSLEECCLKETTPFKEDVDGDTEIGDQSPPRSPSKRRPLWRRRTQVCNAWRTFLIVGSFIMAGLVAIDVLLHPRCPADRRPMDFSGWICAPNGAIPAVARERGCEWDNLSFHWFPKDHTEDEDNRALLREFENNGPWHRYIDQEGKHEIPNDNKVLKAAWLTRREHIVHCKYALRQTHLWVTKGWDPPFNYSHTLHCTGYLVDTIMENPPADMNDITVHVTPWPEHRPVVHPYYPCEEEGIACVSW